MATSRAGMPCSTGKRCSSRSGSGSVSSGAGAARSCCRQARRGRGRRCLGGGVPARPPGRPAPARAPPGAPAAARPGSARSATSAAAAPGPAEPADTPAAGAQRRREQPGGGHRVGHGQVDARPRRPGTWRARRPRSPAGRRRSQRRSRSSRTLSSCTSSHEVSSPTRSAIHGSRPAKRRRSSLDPGRPQRRVGALADQVAALPVVPAVDHHAEVPAGEPAHPARRVVRAAGQPEPPHVHRHAERARPQPGRGPHGGAAAVAGHGQRRPAARAARRVSRSR